MSNIIWLNGEFVGTGRPLISHEDGGFMRGLSVFDTMLGANGQPANAQEHFQRLVHDCKTVLLHEPDIGLDWFISTAEELLKKTGLTGGHARIRTQITTGVTAEMMGKPESPMIIMSAVATEIPDTPAPVHAWIVKDYPRIANCIFENCKRQDYTRSYYAKHKAIENGANEAILTNTDGNIACAVTSSVFIVEGETLVTPPLTDGVLYGITRKLVIREHQALEESISIDRLFNADAVFMTNSILGIRPVQKVNDTVFENIISIDLAA